LHKEFTQEPSIMRKTVLAAIGMTLGLGLAALPAHAQFDEAPAATAPQAQADVPVNGLSMAEVERRFGAPADKLPAIGKPPITRWVYPGFVVYFEYNLVIHSVAREAAPSGG
jgi:hypothetical protein